MIGVNAAARSTGADGRPLQGANFAIPADRTAAVLEPLRRGRSIAWIGASFGYPTVEQLAERSLPPGLFVLGAVPGSGADEAGLGGGGELIAAVDGRPARRDAERLVQRDARDPQRADGAARGRRAGWRDEDRGGALC